MVIALDTEFQRTHTYRPILSIVQIKKEIEEPHIYDVLDKKNKKDNNADIEELISLLGDNSIVKIIHASKQDIEAIYSRFHIVIKNIFDTQIGAKYLGYGNEIGYKNAVKLFVGKDIIKEKTLQNSKWLKRPLTKEQIIYAKQDVEYLHEIYKKMIAYFKNDKNKYEQFITECKSIENDKNYKFNPYYIWQKNKHKIGFSIYYNEIKRLFIEREKLAFKYNLPREFVWKMNDLMLFAKTKDTNLLNSIHRKVDKKDLYVITNIK